SRDDHVAPPRSSPADGRAIAERPGAAINRQDSKEHPMTDKPRITILYCTQCNWLLRAGWMAQELLQTFGDTLGEVALIPGTGGNFEIRIDGTLSWERKRDGGFPGAKELKQKVRDVIEPDRDLGHLDRPSHDGGTD